MRVTTLAVSSVGFAFPGTLIRCVHQSSDPALAMGTVIEMAENLCVKDGAVPNREQLILHSYGQQEEAVGLWLYTVTFEVAKMNWMEG